MTKNFENAVLAAVKAFVAAMEAKTPAEHLEEIVRLQHQSSIGTLNPNPFVPQEEQIVPVTDEEDEYYSAVIDKAEAERDEAYRKVMALLEDSRFTLRSVEKVQQAAGVTDFPSLVSFFEDNDIYFTTARKRRTGEMLVGLESRN